MAHELIFHQDPYTISFDEVNNNFESFYSYFPEYYGCLNTKLFSFYNGQIYAHNNDSTYCNFFGGQFSASITTVFNQANINKKTWISMAQTANSVWICPIIYTQMISHDAVRQESELLEADFSILESTYNASFLKDKNSAGGLIEGDSLKGGYIVVKFQNTSADSFVYLNNVGIKYIDSPLNNR
jgi:hypothetical protein